MTSVGPVLLAASFGGEDTASIVSHLQQAGWCPSRTPDSLTVDHHDVPTKPLDVALSSGGYVQANFEPLARVWVTTGRRVEFDLIDLPQLTVPRVLEVLEACPFEICAFGSLYDWEGYRRWGWGDGHCTLGWGAAFKGSGHDRLVSRRWLEGGPFKVWRGANDVSLVQFHALDADEQTALEQARPGHAEIGNTDVTGFLQSRFVYGLDLSGLYIPETKTIKVVVLGREIPSRELREWAATRVLGRGDYPVGTIERVAYVFPDETEGRAALPRLWRYGHECWVIRDGIELRLDDTYSPPDTTPAWAR
jgi:hypothetical protein